MATEYIVWILIEQCEVDGDNCDCIESVGEPRQAGRFRTERLAFEHVDYLIEQAHAAKKGTREYGAAKRVPRPSNRRR